MKYLKLISLIAIATVLFTQFDLIKSFVTPRSALAVGELTVAWEGAGVGNVGPIFNVNNMAPGNTSSKTITVANGASSSLPVGIKGVLETPPNVLSDALDIKISRSGIDLYGGTTGSKTLSQFLTASQSTEGIFLATQPAGSTSNYLVTVKFNESAGNEYQNKSLSFTLKIGISIDLPLACEGIDFGGRAPIMGTSRGETLNGTSQNDIIMSLGGPDNVDGKDGDDCILGGAGPDKLIGGNGADVILGEEGADSIAGNNGPDKLFGGDGTDSILGGDAVDELYGENGTDSLNGNTGNDILRGGNGTDSLKGENGNDNLNGDAGNDSANGGIGTDTCVAESRTACEL